MLENLYTTKMNMEKKKLESRFLKIRSENGRLSKVVAVVIFTLILAVVLVSGVYIAVKQINKNEYAMSEEDFIAYTNRPIGAIMAVIDYADDDKVVFHYLDGFFITDEKTHKIKHKIDLSKLNVAQHTQGDTVLDLSIDKDGNYAYLSSYGRLNEVKNFDKYIINLNTGEVKIGEMPEDNGVFGWYIGTDTFRAVEGWQSIGAVNHKNTLYYLNFPFGTVGNIQLVKQEIGSDEPKEVRYIFGDKYINLTAKKEKLIKNALAKGDEIIVNSGLMWNVDEDKVKGLLNIFGSRMNLKKIDVKKGNYDVIIYSIEQKDSASPRLFLILNDKEPKLLLAMDLSKELFSSTVNFMESTDKDFEMQDLIGMKNARLSVGGKKISLANERNLAKVEKMLSTAKPMKGGSKCPFEVKLLITNKDGKKSQIHLACDGCAVYKVGEDYYDYSDGGSDELYGLFGITIDEIMDLLALENL